MNVDGGWGGVWLKSYFMPWGNCDFILPAWEQRLPICYIHIGCGLSLLPQGNIHHSSNRVNQHPVGKNANHFYQIPCTKVNCYFGLRWTNLDKCHQFLQYFILQFTCKCPKPESELTISLLLCFFIFIFIFFYNLG